VLRNEGTQQLLSKAVHDKIHFTEEVVYWEQFIGVYDGKDWHQDRLFSTALAVNALLDIWTIKTNNNGQLVF
jgi:hypothetical protein